MSPFDLKEQQAEYEKAIGSKPAKEAVEPAKATKGKRQSLWKGKNNEPYVLGSLPLHWFMEADKAGPHCCAIGLLLWRHAGMKKRLDELKLENKEVFKWLGKDKQAKKRALTKLANRGLIETRRVGNENLHIKILVPEYSPPPLEAKAPEESEVGWDDYDNQE